MTPEGQKPSENITKTLLIVGGLFLLAEIAKGAFSPQTRHEIGTRDKWTCQDCGNQLKDGFMVHASHYEHDKSDPSYDTPEAGRIQCVDCHQEYHESGVGKARTMLKMSEAANYGAIELLEYTDRETRK